jgi:Transposase DDE domain
LDAHRGSTTLFARALSALLRKQKHNKSLTLEGCEIFVFMPSTSDPVSLPSRFFNPALDLLPGCLHQRHCPELSDADWLRLGVQRCLAPQSSGRGFLQTLASLAPSLCPDNSHFFESLKSQRRLALCAELNTRLCTHARLVLPDALAAFPCLAGFDIHAGVQADELVGSATGGVLMRRVTFLDVLTGNTYEYLTNLLESSVPPGVIAHLYKMRWDIEKSFDEVKNKLGEKKAWATSATAKSMQAQFICLSVNLLQFIEHDLGKEGIINEPEVKRRAARLESARGQAASQKTVLPRMLVMMQQMTQHSVKLIRWVAAQLWLHVPWKAACAALAALYAKS